MASRKTAREKFDAAQWHRDLIKSRRYKPQGSSLKNRSHAEEAASDRARIVYSSAFRRLQHKTQVFTLSKDAAVRSRLTHSLEVASVGRWIVQDVVDKRLQPGGLEPDYCGALVSLVETGCLAHDIGNPPFGHFGEAAIQKWFGGWKDVAGKARAQDKDLERLLSDFLYFDGNPQGIRIITRLQGRTKAERREWGMDLTFSQILTMLKYPRGPQDTPSIWNKAGFFESERSKIEPAWKEFGIDPKGQRRFPLAYLVEAADDISYCIGDMEDGIDQGIFKPLQFFDGLKDWVQRAKPAPSLEKLRRMSTDYCEELAGQVDDDHAKDRFIEFKTTFTTTMAEEAASTYGDGSSDDIRHGTRSGLLDDSDAGNLLETLKGIARRFLYPSERVQTPFLAGLRVTHGILDEYGKLLELTPEQFADLRDAWRSGKRDKVIRQKREILLPLLDRLPPHYLDVYDSTMNDRPSSCGSKDAWEWFCRAHLVTDYLSGMTDDYAYRTYQVISGARLE